MKAGLPEKYQQKARKRPVLSLFSVNCGVKLEMGWALFKLRMFSVGYGEPTVYTIRFAPPRKFRRKEMFRCFSESVKWPDLAGGCGDLWVTLPSLPPMRVLHQLLRHCFPRCRVISLTAILFGASRESMTHL